MWELSTARLARSLCRLALKSVSASGNRWVVGRTGTVPVTTGRTIRDEWL